MIRGMDEIRLARIPKIEHHPSAALWSNPA
jgi:hypothetical protein